VLKGAEVWQIATWHSVCRIQWLGVRSLQATKNLKPEICIKMHIDSGSYYRILACAYMGRVDLSIHMLKPERIMRVEPRPTGRYLSS
jgi:hypothetical protein